jgi:starch-binding outer membrane protein, SusD/RagB family
MKPITLLIIVVLAASCKKLMRENPSSNINVPDTFEEMEAMFNDRNTMNATPGLTDLSADNIFLDAAFWQQQNVLQRNAYLCAPDIYGNDTIESDYDLCARQVLNCNLVMEGLNTMSSTSGNRVQWHNLRAQALFFRSCAFYNLAQLFAKPFDRQTAAADPGIPLRITASINDRYDRSTVLQTYHRILSDLKMSIPHLTVFDPTRRVLPSKAAAYAMLARVYQSMSIHDTAALYADSSLLINNQLLNYNTLDRNLAKPFPQPNPEVIFETWASDKAVAISTTFAYGCFVDSALYKSYSPNDLRADIFYMRRYDNAANFKRSYAGSAFPFSGLATDELYLIKAESEARNGNINAAMHLLNTLLKNRWLNGTFTSCTAKDIGEAMDMILKERRKELPLRSVRWADLRRLNKEGYRITPTRVMHGTTYTLLPNDRLYVLPFPPDVIQLTNIQQNDR